MTDILTWGEKKFSAQLFQLAGTSITLSSLVTFGIIVVFAYAISWLLQRTLGRILGRMDLRKPGTSIALKRLTHYVILFIGLLIALQTVGVHTQALLTAGAVFVVAIGFAMQSTVQNFVSGFILLFERMIQPGDVLEVDGNLVKITEMGIRATIARTQKSEDIIFPNSVLVQSTVKNFTMKDSLYRFETRVCVSYDSDMAHVMEVLRSVVRDIPWRNIEKEPLILMDEFGESGVFFRALVWVDDPWISSVSDINERIWWALKAEKIVIPFPQLEIRLDSGVIQVLTGRP